MTNVWYLWLFWGQNLIWEGKYVTGWVHPIRPIRSETHNWFSMVRDWDIKSKLCPYRIRLVQVDFCLIFLPLHWWRSGFPPLPSIKTLKSICQRYVIFEKIRKRLFRHLNTKSSDLSIETFNIKIGNLVIKT